MSYRPLFIQHAYGSSLRWPTLPLTASVGPRAHLSFNYDSVLLKAIPTWYYERVRQMLLFLHIGLASGSFDKPSQDTDLYGITSLHVSFPGVYQLHHKVGFEPTTTGSRLHTVSVISPTTLKESVC